MRVFSDERQLTAARRIFEHVATALNIPFTLQLWDGSKVALGDGAPAGGVIAINGPGVLGSMLRKPSLDSVFRQYVVGGIELRGSDLISTFDAARQVKGRIRLKNLRKGFPWREVLPLLVAKQRKVRVDQERPEDGTSTGPAKRDDKALIQFHYDASNEFYAFFLDKEMVYSCAYFTDWNNSIDQAQFDKLDLICRKLRLAPGERFLDIGCGWGALLCHAAQQFGVEAYGVTLSQAQHDYAQAKIARLGLTDRVKVELRDYMTVEGQFDKIASIGMYEHVRIANYKTYFKRMRNLLADDGIFLNHGITRRAKGNIKRFGKISPSKKVILKYIFPGSELDHIGHSVQVMESCGFEVHDVEGLRLHYGRTCRHWHDRLVANRDQAISHVGIERYRMWIAYLAGVAGGFERGPLHLFQTVASKRNDAGTTPIPQTRADIYVMDQLK